MTAGPGRHSSVGGAAYVWDVTALPDLLFNANHLDEVLGAQRAGTAEAISKIDPDRVLSTPVGDLVDEIYDRFVVNAIVLHEDQRTTPGVRDIKIEVPGYEKMIQVDGSRVEVHVPFDGDPALFKLRPSQFTLNPPRVEVRGEVLVAAYESRSPLDGGAARSSIAQQIDEVQKWLEWQRASINPFNEALRSEIEAAIERRRQKVLSDRQVEAFLEVPIQKRPDAAPTVATGPRRLRPRPKTAAATNSPFVPEPALDDKTFGEILEVIRNTTTMMERVPETARDMGEESLRDHLLIGLNSQFGPATGESFSGRGKTDIYIPVDGRSGTVFIAECKIWGGQAGIQKAVDQLLGYLTWRDTKAALILFQRDGSPEAVGEKLVAAIRNHSAYKRDRKDDGTVFTLAAATDAAREIHIAIVHVPLLMA